ncbi:MAG: PilZ protein [Hydrocarboniphaga sp.]|uniref:PilZ domain-containing protein n=1 Tax=Hydrocarboniphaga sp. TaxID=2033016 RepID=UPI0026248D8A|nr:PilZ domain-containing protein [Hydrocarboniphaga sp.]MDB5970726.1 PilZ protein [Hydrocarboniphaga sp.]
MDDVRPSLVHEAEAQRQHPRVRVAGSFLLDGEGAPRSYRLNDLSAGGLSFDAQSDRFQVGATLRGRLGFQLESVSMVLPITLQIRNVSPGGSRVGGSFMALGTRETSVLRQLINSTLAGELVSTGELINVLSRDNFVKPRAVKDAGGLSGRARFRAMMATAAMALVGIAACFYAGSKLYAMAFVTQASAAKVAAPSFAVTMPRDGTFFSLIPADGIVKKGQPLGSFQAAMLDVVQSDLGSMHLTPEQLSALMGEQLKGTLSSPCDCRVQQQIAFDGQYVNRGQPLFELVPVDAKPYVLARFRFESIDRLPIGRVVAFTVTGDSTERYGKVRDLRLLSPAGAAEASASDMRGLNGASALSDVIATIEPDRPLDNQLIDRPVQATLGNESAISAAVASLSERARTLVSQKLVAQK